ncbi:hypothetical protein VTN00DRAFT_7407 [Thermoascus crustaceus]|uniref:uncharacterized protein n=1 Tax=Thermoascus crustaceus TaxID=5088 RepID=UPI00374474C1
MMYLLLAAAGVVFFFGIARPLFIYFKDEKDLHRFPSPSIAGISNWWLAYCQYHTSRSRCVHEAHQRLGKVVRIQPNHLSFTDPRAIIDIYSFRSGMLKDEFYETFSGEDFNKVNEHSIVNTRDRVDHGRKRKFIAAAFAQKNIVQTDPIVHAVVLKLVRALDNFCKLGPPTYPDGPKPGFINLYKWINLFTYDAIGEIAFGKSFGFLDMGDDIATAETGDGKRYKCHVIPTFQGSSYYDTLIASWSPLIDRLKKLTWFLQGNKNGGMFMDVVNYKVRERLRNGKPDAYRDLFENLMTDRNGEINLDYSEILRESNIFIAAGNDTSATGMTNAMYLLISNPRVTAKLREELEPVMAAIVANGESDGAFHYDQVKDLKYLKACIDEALRRRPPVSMGLSREVPKGGATIAGHFIQEGVSVSVPSFSVHHDPEIFPDPYEYKPERWLEMEGEEKRRALDSFIPFSTGPRACIGRNLAYFEQQILISTLVHRYDFEMVAPDYVLPTVERLNANPGQFWVRVRRRRAVPPSVSA